MLFVADGNAMLSRGSCNGKHFFLEKIVKIVKKKRNHTNACGKNLMNSTFTYNADSSFEKMICEVKIKKKNNLFGNV